MDPSPEGGTGPRWQAGIVTAHRKTAYPDVAAVQALETVCISCSACSSPFPRAEITPSEPRAHTLACWRFCSCQVALRSSLLELGAQFGRFVLRCRHSAAGLGGRGVCLGYRVLGGGDLVSLRSRSRRQRSRCLRRSSRPRQRRQQQLPPAPPPAPRRPPSPPSDPRDPNGLSPPRCRSRSRPGPRYRREPSTTPASSCRSSSHWQRSAGHPRHHRAGSRMRSQGPHSARQSMRFQPRASIPMVGSRSAVPVVTAKGRMPEREGPSHRGPAARAGTSRGARPRLTRTTGRAAAWPGSHGSASDSPEWRRGSDVAASEQEGGERDSCRGVGAQDAETGPGCELVASGEAALSPRPLAAGRRATPRRSSSSAARSSAAGARTSARRT